MATYRGFQQQQRRRQGPQRILPLDGSGLHGTMMVQVSKKIAALPQHRFGDRELRLCD